MAKIEFIEPAEVLRVGQRIEVTISSDKEDNFYTSRIEDFNENSMLLAMPMEKGYPIIPITGNIIYVKLITKQCAYKFISVFMNKCATPIPVWVVSMPGQVEKCQQRQFVRVEATISIKAQIQVANEEDALPVIHAYSRDISGGGLRIIMKHNINPGTRLYLETEDIPGVGSLNVYCEVVRSVKPIATEKIFWVGTKFLDLPEITRSKLIRFIFKRQRELIARSATD